MRFEIARRPAPRPLRRQEMAEQIEHRVIFVERQLGQLRARPTTWVVLMFSYGGTVLVDQLGKIRQARFCAIAPKLRTNSTTADRIFFME